MKNVMFCYKRTIFIRPSTDYSQKIKKYYFNILKLGSSLKYEAMRILLIVDQEFG